MRQDVTFTSKGLRCCGWLYRPDGLREGERAPGIVMAHGFSAVKEMYLANFAERFAAAGFVTLAFDYRFFGASEGEPRGQLFPLEQQEDYRAAITWLSDQPFVDPERIGVWGSSLSGGLVLYLATHERRIKAVVAQVPSTVNLDFRIRTDPARAEALRALVLEDRLARHRTGALNYLKVISPEGDLCWLRPADACEWFTEAGAIAPNWENAVTMESVEKVLEFDPVSLVHLIAPTALLLIAAEHDSIIPLAAPQAAFARAGEPKALKVLPCGHFDLYDREPWFTEASSAAVEWFTKYL
jgi:fermentation-respiration switch protein FrsA (DUF1100 family)